MTERPMKHEPEDVDTSTSEAVSADGPPEEPDRFNWGLLLAIGVFTLILAGLLYLALQPNEEPPSPPGSQTETYGPWVFEWEGPFWKTIYQREGQVFDIRFRYLPQEVDTITVQGTEARLISPFYLTIDPEMSNATLGDLRVAIADSTLKLFSIYRETPIAACTRNDTDPACATVPTVTCDTPNASAIIFRERAEPSVTLNGTCIIVTGTGPDLYRAETLMWYRLLGIVR